MSQNNKNEYSEADLIQLGADVAFNMGQAAAIYKVAAETERTNPALARGMVDQIHPLHLEMLRYLVPANG